ncbi:MAG: DUF6261 family protein [Prevotellaceae bacterium]|jgi:hypothetical protein|nr:DUF6261 family protein [Prevotellaceae bacterium]
MHNLLSTPDNTRYFNPAHVSFHTVILALCILHEDVIDAAALITAYKDAVTQETDVYEYAHISELTRKKEAADHARDHAVTGVLETVRVAMRNFDPVIRERAYRIHDILSDFGDVRQMAYDGESAAVDSLVENFRSATFLPDIQALGLVAYVNEMATQNNLFKTYADQTADLNLQRPPVSMKEARVVTDHALKKITDRVIAKVNLNGITGFGPFVAKFNELTDHANDVVKDHYGRIHARIDITTAVTAPIPVQTYTGKPIFVIPEATLRYIKDGVEHNVVLVFATDFALTYRDNIEPGLATVIMQGIGKYAGERVVTFNIA